MGPEVLAGILPRIYPQMLDEVHRHQDEGRATFIVSAAGNDLVKRSQRSSAWRVGSGPAGRSAPTASTPGRWTGPFVYGEGKVEAMQQFADRHDIDLDASYAYSDSASDLPMLRSVGNAVVVNPDAVLAGDRPAGGLAGDALRKARPEARDRGRHGARRGRRRGGSSGVEAAQHSGRPWRAAGPYGAESRHRLVRSGRTHSGASSIF